MSSRQPQTVLVLGGIRSGKSEFAESLVASAESVRYVATSEASVADPEWGARIAAHQGRRPATWNTEEIGKAPGDLATLIADADRSDTILVDDIGGWLTALLDTGLSDTDRAPGQVGSDITGAIEAVAVALSGTSARVVIVSPEVGMSLIPATPVGRAFADACGSANRALAEACDGAVLILAGQPTWLKVTAGREPGPVAVSAPRPRIAPAAAIITATATATDDGGATGEDVFVGMPVPVPDNDATTAATERLGVLPVAGAGLGMLAAAVEFAAGAQGTGAPQPFGSIRVIQVHGASTGAIAAGDDEDAWTDRLAATRAGTSPLARLAAEAGAGIEMLDAGRAAPIEDGGAATGDEIVAALHRGWRTANAAADRGDDLLVLAAGGPGVDAAAAAVVAAITTSEIPALLGRVWRDGGRIDDQAWMARCVAIRDALRRSRERGTYADGPTALAAFGGPVLATAVGLLLGAAQRRTPVMIDGPVGAAAALVARDYATPSRLWYLLADHGNHPTVRVAADMLSLEPVVELGTGLGEGASALTVLPLIQSALAISALTA